MDLVNIGTKVVDSNDPFAELKIMSGPISNIRFEIIKSHVYLIFPLPEATAAGASDALIYSLFVSANSTITLVSGSAFLGWGSMRK